MNNYVYSINKVGKRIIKVYTTTPTYTNAHNYTVN